MATHADERGVLYRSVQLLIYHAATRLQHHSGVLYRLRSQEFLVKWPIQESLRRLVAGGGADASQAVLVRRQAQSLLDAFRVNTVF